MRSRAMALRQIARDLCVWPDRSGRLFTLPSLTAAAAQEQAVANVMRALAALGHLSDDGLELACKNLPWLAGALAQNRRNEQYHRYLAAMAQLGQLRPEQASSAQDLAARDCAAGEVVRGLLVEERTGELADLAQALGMYRPEPQRPFADTPGCGGG